MLLPQKKGLKRKGNRLLWWMQRQRKGNRGQQKEQLEEKNDQVAAERKQGLSHTPLRIKPWKSLQLLRSCPSDCSPLCQSHDHDHWRPKVKPFFLFLMLRLCLGAIDKIMRMVQTLGQARTTCLSSTNAASVWQQRRVDCYCMKLGITGDWSSSHTWGQKYLCLTLGFEIFIKQEILTQNLQKYIH